MPNNQNLGLIGASIVNVGLSAIVKISGGPYLYATNVKIYSGGGTLEIVPPVATLSGTGATGWGIGYAISANETVAFDGPATYYLAATGATMRATILLGYSQGATIGVI
jgi:hypothetical protein